MPARLFPTIDHTEREDAMATVREVFHEAGAAGLEREEAIHHLARALGFGRVSSHIHEVLDGDIRAAVRRYILYRDGSRLYLDCRNIRHYPRARLREAVAAAVGRSWTTRPEAIRLTARYLGFRRAGAQVQQAIKTAITGALRTGILEREGNSFRRA